MSEEQPLRVAVVGCGAAARELHLPVLSGHPRAVVTALVDVDRARAQALADAYHVPRVFTRLEELDRHVADAVVLCTPPFHHAPGALALVGRGLHVLVEKPIATSSRDAQAMVDAAANAHVVLAVGVFRRLFPSTRLARRLLHSGWLGRILDFDAEEGEVYGWPTATLGNMRRDLAGGGVLIDFGSHTMDRLLYMFPEQVRVLEYHDNAQGGVESDCVVRLEMGVDGVRIPGRIELSRTRNLRNSFRFRCERGTIELKSGDRYSVLIHPAIESGDAPPLMLEATAPGQTREESWYGSFAAQFEEWHEAIRTGRPCELAGSVALQAMTAFESCYASPKTLEEPWVAAAVPRNPGTTVKAGDPPVVLVTGATGFIGGRTAEVLALFHGWKVRALVHNPAHASRLARLPVEMVLADLGDAQAVTKAVEGCDAVVHCAIGTAWGDRRRIFDVTVEGTRRLLEAARRAGVRRFVHLSTFAVHDLTRPGVIDESTPPNPPSGSDYAESKAEADRLVQGAAAASLSAVILRLANVYGPYSTIFTTRPVQHLVQGTLRLVGPATEIPSSTVFVDSVVGAIVRALEASDADVRGQTFTISDGDTLSWSAFFGYFADAAGVPLRTISDEEYSALRRDGVPQRGLGWWVMSPFRGAAQVVRSPEMWSLVKRTLKTDPIYAAGQAAFERSPALKRQVSSWLGIDTPPVYEPPPESGTPEPFDFELTRPYVDNARACTVLGFTPTPREEAMAITRDWLRYARILP